MNNETRLLLHGIKWLIERDNWAPHVRKEMNKDICDKIVEALNPKESDSKKRVNKAVEEKQ